jgi:TPR repeat protein
LEKLMTKTLLIIIMLSPNLAWGGPQEVRQAALAGDAEMQFELGELYEFGFGLKQNYIPALAWYILAAEQGNQKASKRHDVLKSRMTREQIEEAQNQAQLLRKQLPSSAPAAAPLSARETLPPPERSGRPSPVDAP